MSKLEKELERLRLKQKDYTYDEAKSLLNKLGFIENNKGKTSGSRVIFKNYNLDEYIELHKPHPKIKALEDHILINELIKNAVAMYLKTN